MLTPNLYTASVGSLPVFALKLSDKLPLLFVDVKVYAAVGYHLGRVSVTYQSSHKLQDRKLPEGSRR